MSPENSNPKPEVARPLSRQERIEQLKLEKSRLREQAAAAYKLYRELYEENCCNGCSFHVGGFVDADSAVWQIYNNYANKEKPYGWLVICCGPDAKNDSGDPEAAVQGVTENSCTERWVMPYMPTGIEAVDTLHLAGVGVNIFWKKDKDKDKDKDSKGKGSVVAVADNRGIEFLPLDELIAKKNAKKNDTDNKRPEEITADNKEDDTDKRFKEITGPLEKDGLGATAVSTMVRVAA
jgi:hypothetical protein